MQLKKAGPRWRVDNMILCCLLALLSCGLFTQAADHVTPEQVHLSYGAGGPTEMMVTWSTLNFTMEAVVQYGEQGLTHTAQGYTKKFVDSGSLRHTQYIHTVRLTDLKAGTLYYYRCGGPSGWSQTFHFLTLPEGSDWMPRFVMYGDLGVTNGISIPALTEDVQNHEYDAILHVGDFAYDMDTNNATVGDKFMNLIQPVAAFVPYMTCPGNHENAHNFSNYKNRFVMPGDEASDNMFYSFNIGPVHVISYSTEYYFYINYGLMQPIRQYEWIEKDLEEANKPENRARQPWIVTMGHRPMYCSNDDHDDCTRHESIVRTGVPLIHVLGLEKLFYKYGVDLVLEAHEHSYERLWPVHDRKVMNGSYEAPYTNPRAPVHIITGSAGCQEGHDHFRNGTEAWSAFRSDDYGYARMTVNRTHLYLEQVSVEQHGGEVIDKITIIKDRHGPYEY